MTQEGMVMGTADYIAPEQAVESHTVDIRADLYSLGCTFYYLLTGKVPFPGGTFIQKINKHQFERPRPLEHLRPDVPPAVAQVVRTLMAKNPADRYQKPADVAAALTGLTCAGSGAVPATLGAGAGQVEDEPRRGTLVSALAYMAQGGDTAVESPARPREKAKGRRWLLVGAAAGSLVLAAAAVLLFLFPGNHAGKKAPAKEEERPVAAFPAAKKPPAKVDEAWLKKVAGLPAAKQVEAVAAKLKELNPGFEGKVMHTGTNGVVTGLTLVADNVTDLSPVRALTGLTSLACNGSAPGAGKLSDLTPLAGMPLTTLSCGGTKVSDLSPLKGMPLRSLNCSDTIVGDLSPLAGLPLTNLGCWGTKVSDLTPLKDMKLMSLNCSSTPVADLSPLKGTPLREVNCAVTKVSDLSPLRGMPLTSLGCTGTQVSDLSPLVGMPLKVIGCDFKAERDAEILRSIKTLETINGKPAKEFWQEIDKKPDKKP
jgi:hypothetical protein